MTRIRSSLIILFYLPCLTLSPSLSAEDNGTEKIEDGEVIYIEAPAYFKCRVLLPKDYNPEKSYPLVVGLHGRYADAEYAISIWKQFQLDGYIYAAPQAPYPESKGYSWGASDPEAGKLWDRTKEASERYIADSVKYLMKNYSVNAEQIYLLGHSQGAVMALNAGIKNHELFKGLLCFSGWLNKYWLAEEKIEAAKNLRIFIAHGKKDRDVRYSRGTEARDILKKHGLDVTFVPFDGGHPMSDEAVKEAVKWLKK